MVIGYAILQQVSGICPQGLGTLITSMLLCQSFCCSLGLLWHLPHLLSSPCQGAPPEPSILVGGGRLWAALGVAPPLASLGFL